MPKLEAVGIVVSDMAASLAFYRLLGLDFPEGADTEAHVTAIGAGGVDVMFDVEDVVRGFDASWSRTPGRGSVALAFRCEGAAKVDATVAAIADAGQDVHLEPWDAFWGQRYAVVVDPDGTHVDVFADLE
jgi:uncharacterized glyoxalase superfamily protein PhnB